MAAQMQSSIQSLPGSKGVLVTGCSSGIGRAVALHLAQRGFTVFATVRKQTDADHLRSFNEPNLVPVCPLDLTQRDHLPGIVKQVTNELQARGLTGLYAIVNNAGGGAIAPLELLDLDKFYVELQTRILGPVALLQAFLPLIRQAQGRVVWIVTPALMPVPYVASIHACDYAVNCLARTLELELKPWNIPNIQIRCGGIQTAAVGRSAQELATDFQQWPSERFELYRERLTQEQAELAKFDEKRSQPEDVARVVYKALNAARPKRRYQIGYLSGFAAAVELLPQTWVDWIMARRG